MTPPSKAPPATASGMVAAGSLMERLLAPTAWLSGRLSFTRKYLLIGVVVLLALASLSWPLLRQTRDSSALVHQERQGLRAYVQQTNALAALVTLRSQAVRAQPPELDRLEPEMRALLSQTAAVGGALTDPTLRLSQRWAELKSLGADEDPLRRFAAHTGVVNALLGLIRESARVHRLNVDPSLDAAFDMLADRLPLVMETLAKQQDALSPGSEGLASYALGAQVVLSELAPALRAGVAQLVAQEPQAEALKAELAALQADIVRQQDAADKVLAEPAALDELRRLATANQLKAHHLLSAAAAQADTSLQRRLDDLRHAQWVVAGLMIGAIGAIAYLFAGIYLSTQRSLGRLSQGTAAFCSGQLETRITMDTQDELVLVARNFNTMAVEVGRLLGVIQEQNESRQRELERLVQLRTAEIAEKNEQLRAAGLRVQEELSLARDMQQAILPQHFPKGPDWTVHACMNPARELGGDFYDCFALPGGRLGVLVADVSGKGVGAAFFMAVSRTVLLDLAMADLSPCEVFARANDLLGERNPMELFVTACYAVYDPEDGSLVYASAGHPPPLLRQVSGRVRPLKCPSDVALGVLPGMTYSDQQAQLAPGETLLLFTDGVTEAFAPDNVAYGDVRLAQWLARSPGGQARLLVDSLVADVAGFVNGAEASDDLTCLVLCRKHGEVSVDARPIELHNKVLLLDHRMASRLEEIAALAGAVDDALPDRSDLAFAVNLCLEELITNTIQHGLHGAPDRSIHVRLSRSDEWLEIILKDDAPPFDPFAQAPAPDLSADVGERQVGGLGVHMVKTMMDEVRAYYDGSGNLIVLLKTLQR